MQRSQFTLEGWRTESTLLGLEHVVRGILGISGLILRPPRWLGGKEKIIIIIKKRTLFGRTLDTLPAANAVHSHLHKSKGRAGCCYSDKSQICRALLREHMRLSGLPRSPNLTLNHVCMFFFHVPDHFENLWFYAIFCLGGFSCLFFHVSPYN